MWGTPQSSSTDKSRKISTLEESPVVPTISASGHAADSAPRMLHRIEEKTRQAKLIFEGKGELFGDYPNILFGPVTGSGERYL